MYLAEDTKLQRQVALTVFPKAARDNPECLAMFQREYWQLPILNHPNIAQVYAFEKIGDELFISMEFVPSKQMNEQVPNENRASICI